jgi:hypothetical protein
LAWTPLAAIGTAREHGFEFCQLPFAGIDEHCERVMAARCERSLAIVDGITLEELHIRLRRYPFGSWNLARLMLP